MTKQPESRMARHKKKQSQKKNTKKSWIKKTIITLLIVFIAAGIGVGGLFTYYIATAPEIDVEKLSDPFSSKVYDMDGNLFADLGDVKRTPIRFEDLPDHLVDAVTATEDVRFFSHFGIDLKRVAGAIYANITRGFGAEGASTITQQVVENSFLSKEKKLKRKVQEQWLAIKLERDYSKQEIMEIYLNKIYFGSGAYGVAKAAEVYFGKTDLHDLTLIEAAVLAGLPQRPSAYDPFENPELTKDRVDIVLTLMVRHGKISQEEANEARAVAIEDLLTDKKTVTAEHDAFLRKVREEVRDKLEGADINTDGLKIYTTMDSHAQQYVEDLLTDREDHPIDYPDDELQAGLVVLDTNSGAIRAIGGSRNRDNNDGYNYAIQGGRQPGSTIKPIIAYGPAIEYNKASTYHQLHDDEPYPIAGTDHSIRNWDRVYRGWVTSRYGLSRSLNVPTVKTFLEVDQDKVKEFGENIGIHYAEDPIPITEVIGGATSNFTPLQMAGAFRAFANEGIYNEPYAVTKVEYPDGSVVDLRPKSEAVMSDYTAYMITDMLKSALLPNEGTGRLADISGLPVAGKTGTTNLDNDRGVNNSWFSGYTTNYTIAIWAGYEEHNRAMENTHIPQHLFRHIMTELSKDIETPDFKKPDSVVEVEIEKGSNPPKLPSAYTPKDEIVTELFVKGTEPDAVSAKYDQLDPVDDLQASYDADEETIIIDWNYGEESGVFFEVSAKVNDGERKTLAETEETKMTISDVEFDASYEIQVIAKSAGELLASDPRSVTVKTPEPEEEKEDIPPVKNLQATYDVEREVIDVDWDYDGPDASFRVLLNQAQEKTVESKGIDIEGGTPGETYTITVIPVGKDSQEEGEARSVEQTIPADESPDHNNDHNNNNEPDENNEYIEEPPEENNNDNEEVNAEEQNRENNAA